MSDKHRDTSDQPKNAPQRRVRRSWLRFRLRAVLLAFASAAACLTSYRIGIQHGRLLGPIVPTDVSSEKLYTREYDVTDLIVSVAEAKLVTESLRRIATPDAWDVVGGFAVVAYDAGQGTLAVSHVWEGHASVVRFLSVLRRNLTGKGISHALSTTEREWDR